VRLSEDDFESALSEYIGPTGKRSAVKITCSVWSRRKAEKPYLLPQKELEI